MKKVVGKVATNRYGLHIDGISVDRYARVKVGHGDVVEYYIRTIPPKHGGPSFQVAVPIRVLSEEELLGRTPILHRFENVEIRGIEFGDGGKAIIQSKDSEPRWTGEELPVYDRRDSSADIAIVIVLGDSREEFGKTVEVPTAVILESWKDQEDEPDLVLDVLSYRSNTKNVTRHPDLSKTVWSWYSRSGHANIHSFQEIVVIPFGETIVDKYSNNHVYRSYQRESFESFEASCVKFLSSGKGSTNHNWVRPDGDSAWIAWDWHFSYRRRIEIIPNPSGRSGRIVYEWDDDTFGTRHIFEYEFKRLSHFARLMRKRVGKGSGHRKETFEKRYNVSSIDKETGLERFSDEDQLILSKRGELEKAGYSIYRSTTAYTGCISVYRGLKKSNDSLRSWSIAPIVYGFVPAIRSEQIDTFAKAVEILAGDQELVITLDLDQCEN